MKHRGLITTLTCSMVLASLNTSIVAAATIPESGVPTSEVLTETTTAPATETTDEAGENVTIQNPIPSVNPTLDATPDLSASTLFDLDFSKASIVDKKNPDLKIAPFGKPTLGTVDTMDGQVGLFDGKSAYSMPVTDDQYTQIANGFSIEAYFRYDDTMGGEHEIFSNQQNGGFGLGVDGGQINLFAHVGGDYRRPKAPVKPGRWVHAVGVYDKTNESAQLYLDGKLVSKVDAKGSFKLASTKNIVVGGDSGSGNTVQYLSQSAIKTARLYNRSLSASEIDQLNQAAQIGKHEPEVVAQPTETRMIGANTVAKGHTYGLNVHLRQTKAGDSEPTTVYVKYDPSKFEYVNASATLRNTIITKVKDGQLKITTTASLSAASFKKYVETRLAHLNFKALDSGTTTFQFSTDSKDGKMTLGADQKVEIHEKDSQDYNKDGIIGVGDVALAPKDQQKNVAKNSEIKPYKHVIVLTTDGGGNPWNPEGMYFATGNNPIWHTDPATLAKRKNTYTMDLFNKQFAMSTTAKSVNPAISAQNYISMLHGLPWGNLPSEYQSTNNTAAQNYFSDFDKTEAQYPSVFKVLQKNNPAQGLAAFSKWVPIINGIIEPDAAVMTKGSEQLKSFDDVANYVGSPDFKDTALVYMQSDYMDHQGHGKGFYNDNYWKEYARYDQLFKTVMDKLEATGHIHDTLVIANADHGGSGNGHGGTNPNNADIFIALGGETVDSGRRLKGGSNADISALILDALQVEQPETMTAKVFDDSAYLKQTDLIQKERDVEKIKLTQSTKQVQLALTNPIQGREIRAIDLVIDLAGRSVNDVKVPAGTTVVRQSVEKNLLKLTLSFDKQPTDQFATLQLNDAKAKSDAPISVEQAMAGTTQGDEVLVDLVNDKTISEEPSESKPGTGDNGSNTNGNGSNTSGGQGSTHKPDTGAQKPQNPDTGAHKPSKPYKPAKKPNNQEHKLSIATVPSGSHTINSGRKAVIVYENAATTRESGSTLSTDYAQWTVTQVAKNTEGKVVAYDLGNNQWVKASEVTLEKEQTNSVSVDKTVSGDALYSNWKAAPIYSDPAATKQIRTLSTDYNEWSAFKVSKDAKGKVIAYDLGGGQWVKASDLSRQFELKGTLHVPAGTEMMDAKGKRTGTISTTDAYQIFAVRYINGHQALKLGDDTQWVIAASGDYYPAS